ncbi:hypothetical protein StoSoilA2_34430 [Arthrobacter sp. StoSoilA2]|nr:hypothetical protein StoSoilA2_34430 [Arthrobacter sp. StoSoilA2]
MPDPPQNLMAIHVWKSDVQCHRHGLMMSDNLDAFASSRGGMDYKSRLSQDGAHQIPDVLIILNDYSNPRLAH